MYHYENFKKKEKIREKKPKKRQFEGHFFVVIKQLTKMGNIVQFVTPLKTTPKKNTLNEIIGPNGC